MQKGLLLKIGVSISLFIVLIILSLIFAGNYFVNYAIVRTKDVNKEITPPSIVTTENQMIINKNLDQIEKQKEKWLTSIEITPVDIISNDGLTLKGDILWSNRASHKWLIAVHGYTNNRKKMQNIASFYGINNYNILTPDLRSHGESEGVYIGMGWLDREDILKWAQYIIQLDKQAEIILHGISMGGATVMMAAGDNLPANVKGIVEDCGYTSVWDIFADEMRYLFHLPEFPFLYASNLVTNIRAGYDLKTASALEQVKKSKLPILFIHGSEDTMVHPDMAYTLYAACPTQKSLLIVEGAGHAESYQKAPDLYFKTIFEFLEQNCNMK